MRGWIVCKAYADQLDTYRYIPTATTKPSLHKVHISLYIIIYLLRTFRANNGNHQSVSSMDFVLLHFVAFITVVL